MGETILLVEDDVSIRKALQLNLQLEGYEVLCAEDGETRAQAVGKRAHRSDCRRSDAASAVGLDLIRELRQRRAELPILVLSAGIKSR